LTPYPRIPATAFSLMAALTVTALPESAPGLTLKALPFRRFRSKSPVGTMRNGCRRASPDTGRYTTCPRPRWRDTQSERPEPAHIYNRNVLPP
jgi:hypothetical protein